jgi:hypothetical protein
VRILAKKTYQIIKGIFKNTAKEKWENSWKFDCAKLEQLTSSEFAHEINDSFNDMHDGIRFKAQVIEVNGVNHSGGNFRFFKVSLGHWIYSYHYTFYPHDNTWIKTTINQEFFEDIIKPFQSKITKRRSI